MRAKRKREAFSLVEICLALGLVAFCLVSLLGLLQAGLRQERQSLDQIRAAHILTAVADEILGLIRPPAGIGPAAESRYSLSLPGAGQSAAEASFAVDENGAPQTDSPAYVVHYRIEPPPADGGAFRPYRIRLLVAWPGTAAFTSGGAGLDLQRAQGKAEAILEVNRE